MKILNEGGSPFGGLSAQDLEFWFDRWCGEHKDELKQAYIDEGLEDIQYFARLDFSQDDREELVEKVHDNCFLTLEQAETLDYSSKEALAKSFIDLCNEIIDSPEREWIDNRYYETFLSDVVDVAYENAVDDIGKVVKDTCNELRELSDRVYVYYDIETSRSWNRGRWPSVYYTVEFNASESDDEDEISIRVSDNHPNGRDADNFEVDWTTYEEEKNRVDKELRSEIKYYYEQFVEGLD